MEANLILIAPIVSALLTILLWAIFQHNTWSRKFSRAIFWSALAAVAIYILAFVASLIGDKLHGPADSFAWSPVYIVTWPMLLFGWFISVATFLIAVIGAIIGTVLRERKRSRTP